MEKELSIIDGILMNLAGIQRFYEFEYTQLSTLLGMLQQFRNETVEEEKELGQTSEIFERESDKEVTYMELKLKELNEKITKIKSDIASRAESKKKLMELFKALKSVDSLDTLDNTKSQPKNDDTKTTGTESLPVFDIREELDDEGNVISSEVKPYGSPESQLEELLKNNLGKNLQGGRKAEKEVDTAPNKHTSLKPAKQPDAEKTSEIQPTSSNDSIKTPNGTACTRQNNNQVLEETAESDFCPFVIREEIDEDGNTIKSSMARMPRMKPTEEEAKLLPPEVTDENKDIEEDQLAELFQDMGFEVSKTAGVEELDTKASKIEVIDDEQDTTIEKIPLKGEEEHLSNGQSYSVDTENYYTLELIADQLNQSEEYEEEEELITDDNVGDYEWPEIDGLNDFNGKTQTQIDIGEEQEEEENDEDDEIQQKILSNMFGTNGHNLFKEKLISLRSQNRQGKDILPDEVKIEKMTISQRPDVSELVQEIQDDPSNLRPKKFKKSVSFNSTVDVKKVPDIWDDLRVSNAENEIINIKAKESASPSLFSRSVMQKKKTYVEEEKVEEFDQENSNDTVMSDVIERQIVESSPGPNSSSHDVFKTFDSTTLRKSIDDNMQSVIDKQNLTKLSGKKAPSRFKLARAAEMGKKFQETHVTAEVREQLQSLVSSVKPAPKPKAQSTETGLKKNLKSLLPRSSTGRSTGTAIVTPKDINPLPVNPSLQDEDYEIIRSETTEDLFDDDEDMVESEFVASQITDSSTNVDNDSTAKYPDSDKIGKSDDIYFPHYEKNTTEDNKEIIGTTLDYKSLSDDLDTMAKAYVLGLYDDDIETRGDVIEELGDFEKYNKIVEDREDKKLHERVGEINKKFEDPDGKIEEILEDDNPMVVSDIVENDIVEIMQANSIPDDQLDIELNDETLTTQVALDYTKMRSNMIHKYKGGFKETDQEKEFVRPEGTERISRFKMARLGI